MDETSRKNKETVRIIWFDSSTKYLSSRVGELKRLRDVFDSVIESFNEDATVQTIESLSEETIILITSGQCALSILSKVIDLKQIDSVFIYCYNVNPYVSLKERFSKIIDVLRDFNKLLQSIQRRVALLHELSQSFLILDRFNASTHDVSQQSAEFLWFQLAKHLIFLLPTRDNAKQALIEYCRHYYRDNQWELDHIEDFEKNYCPQDIFRWYTKESFIYKMINKALRSQDIKQLERFSFLIKDLSKELARQHLTMLEGADVPLTTYRGAQLQRSEVDQLLNNSNPTICSQGFWSTTRYRGRALAFAKKYPDREDIVNVLFEIDGVDNIRNITAIFADISSFSAHPSEQEILFDLSTSFTITSTIQQNNIQVIRLKLINNAVSPAETHFYKTFPEMKQLPSDFAFVLLLIEMGHYQQAQEYLESSLKNAKKEHCHWIEMNLGRVKYYQGQLVEARQHYDHVYELMMKTSPPQIQESAAVLNNIGNVLHNEGKFNEALETHQKVLQIRQQYLRADDIDIQRSFMNIGSCLRQLREYTQAVSWHKQALELHSKYRPSMHPERAMCWNNLGNVQADQRDFDVAIHSHQEALQIRKTIFPPHHPHLAESWQNLGNVHRERGDFDEAHRCLQCALDIRKISFSANHPLIADTFYNRALVYQSQNNCDQALQYHQKALHIRENHYIDAHRDIFQSLNSIGTILIERKEFNEAVKYCQRAERMHSKIGLRKDDTYATCLHNLGVIWYEKQQCEKAKKYLLEAGEIRGRYLSKDHIDVHKTKYYLDKVLKEMQKH